MPRSLDEDPRRLPEPAGRLADERVDLLGDLSQVVRGQDQGVDGGRDQPAQHGLPDAGGRERGVAGSEHHQQ
jgi:hypothetical protein